MRVNNFKAEDVLEVELFFTLEKVLAMQLVLKDHQKPHYLII